MRVEAYNQVQQLYQTKKTGRQQAAGSAPRTDKLQISTLGRDFQTAKTAVAAAPDVREEITAPIKARVQSGTYNVDNTAFAGKLYQKYEELMNG